MGAVSPGEDGLTSCPRPCPCPGTKRHRRPLLLPLGLLLLLGSGCHIIYKDSFWEDTKAARLGEEPALARVRLPFLGVRVDTAPVESSLGARVRHVFGSSSA